MKNLNKEVGRTELDFWVKKTNFLADLVINTSITGFFGLILVGAILWWVASTSIDAIPLFPWWSKWAWFVLTGLHITLIIYGRWTRKLKSDIYKSLTVIPMAIVASFVYSIAFLPMNPVFNPTPDIPQNKVYLFADPSSLTLTRGIFDALLTLFPLAAVMMAFLGFLLALARLVEIKSSPRT